MNKIMFRFLSVILAFSVALGSHFNAGAAANNYYVSTTGNDANAGTSSAPFKTISKCASVAVAGDTCNISGGTYSGILKPAKSGTANAPITFQRLGSSAVIIKSTDWTNINIDTKDYLVFDGLTIVGNGSNIGVVIHNGSHNIIKNCDISKVTIGVHIYGGNSSSMETGVSAVGNVVSGNSIHDTSSSLGEGVYVKNYMDSSSVSFTRDTIIENNTIYNAYEAIQNTAYTWKGGALTAGGIAPTGTIVRGNTIRNNNCEQGVISMVGNGHLIENNTIVNNKGTGSFCGVSLRGGTMTVRYNLITDGVLGAMRLNDVYGDVYNNTITNYATGIAANYSTSSQLLAIKNNIIYVPNQPISSSGDVSKLTWSGNYLANPPFVGSGDYHLQAGSSACGFGAFSCSVVVPSATPSSVPGITPTKTFTPTPVPLTATATALPATSTKLPTATATAVPFTPTAMATNTAAPTVISQPTATPVPTIVISNDGNSVDIRVARGSDDVEENSYGRMYANSSDLELIYDSSVQVVGLRFTGVNIPMGATITNAYIQFEADQTDRRAVSLTIAGEANSNALAFSNTARNVSKRARTSNSATWSPSSWSKAGETGTSQRTPNLNAIVQEIVNQSNWNSGNSMVMIITGKNNGKRVAKSFEGSSSGAPMLHVEFSMPAQAQEAMALLLPATPTPTPTATLVTPLSPPTIMATFTSEPTQIPPSPTMVATEIVISTETPSPTPIPPSPTVEVVVPTETPDPLTPITQGLTTSTSKTESANIVDVANGYPVITSNGSVSIVENTTAVTTVTAADADLPAQPLTYSIAGGADSALFSINPSTGELTFIATPDFEIPTDAGVDNIYNLTVQVSDGMLAVTQDIAVTVTVVSDNNPSVTSNGSVSIAENTITVTTVTAADADLPTETLTYSIAGGTDAALFSINSSTGELTFMAAPDFEIPTDAGVDNIYNVTVQVFDGTLVSTQDIAVTVIAVSDNTPSVTSNGSVSIAENTTAVTTVTAADADLPTETLTYSITSGTDAALFSINSSTGELTFIAAPDFEVPTDAGVDNIYNVTVQVSDRTLVSTQDIVITVTAVNDNNPVITSNGSTSIAENTTAATTVTAADADLPTETLTYSIAGGTDATLFSINSSTGELTFTAAPDFEVPTDAGVDNIYNVTVQASDGTLTTTQDVAVTVTAVNDNTPSVTSNGSVSIAENTTVVATVTAKDSDLPTQTLAYSLSGGADLALFSINSSTGELTFIAAPDFEAPKDAGMDNIYNVQIQVSDGTLVVAQDIVATVKGGTQPQ